jgi:hypothetical protein
LRRELGLDARALVKLEAPGAKTLLRVLGRMPKLAAALARPFRFGTRGGYVEVCSGDRKERITSHDQRMAILPVVFALERIAAIAPGVHTPSVFDADELLRFVER